MQKGTKKAGKGFNIDRMGLRRKAGFKRKDRITKKASKRLSKGRIGEEGGQQRILKRQDRKTKRTPKDS